MIKKRLKILILLFVTWFVIHQASIIIDGLNDELVHAEVAVVFGNTVNEDGSLSERLKARLDKGIELYRDSLVDRLFVSGGLGKEGFYEGNKMAEYLIANQIPTSVIIVDNEGNNTEKTAINFRSTYPIGTSVIVVTQYYHISRAKLALRKKGVDQIYGVHCNYFEIRDFYSCFREFFGYYKYLFIN